MRSASRALVSVFAALARSARSIWNSAVSTLPSVLDCPASKNIGSSSVKTASALVTEPALLLTTAENRAP